MDQLKPKSVHVITGGFPPGATAGHDVVDASVDPAGGPPTLFRGAWETVPFEQLLRNGITWGLRQEDADL
jgi:hypothetical protein